MAFSTADVRSFMMRAFSASEIETFCFDHFPDVHNLFTPEMTKSDRIQHLIEYCARRERAADLFAALTATLPEQMRAVFGAGPYPAQFTAEIGPARSAPPSLEAHSALLDRLIATQRSAVSIYISLALGLVLVGFLIGLGGVLLLSPRLPPDLSRFTALGSGVGGLFVASLSIFQAPEIIARRERLAMFTELRGQVVAFALRGTTDAATWERIDSLVWQAVAKTAVG